MTIDIIKTLMTVFKFILLTVDCLIQSKVVDKIFLKKLTKVLSLIIFVFVFEVLSACF
jgi:hypothetical protein